MMRLCETNYLAILVLCTMLVIAIQARSPPRRDVCRNHKCPRGQMCRVMPNRCVGPPCRGEVPLCIKHPIVSPVVKPGRCPSHLDLPWSRSKSRSRRCRRSCRYDGDCPRNLKCCKVGRCGKICVRPRRMY